MNGTLAIWGAFLAWGMWGFASHQAVQRTPTLTLQWIISLPYVIAVPVWYILSRRAGNPSIPEWGSFGWGILACSSSLCGTFLYNLALRTEKPSVVVGVSSAYPLLTVFLLIALGLEPFRWQQGVALLLIVAGVITLQL